MPDTFSQNYINEQLIALIQDPKLAGVPDVTDPAAPNAYSALVVQTLQLIVAALP